MLDRREYLFCDLLGHRFIQVIEILTLTITRMDEKADSVFPHFGMGGGCYLDGVVRFEVNHLVNDFLEKNHVGFLLTEGDSLAFGIIKCVSFMVFRPILFPYYVDIRRGNVKIA